MKEVGQKSEVEMPDQEVAEALRVLRRHGYKIPDSHEHELLKSFAKHFIDNEHWFVEEVLCEFYCLMCKSESDVLDVMYHKRQCLIPRLQKLFGEEPDAYEADPDVIDISEDDFEQLSPDTIKNFLELVKRHGKGEGHGSTT